MPPLPKALVDQDHELRKNALWMFIDLLREGVDLAIVEANVASVYPEIDIGPYRAALIRRGDYTERGDRR